MPPVRLAQANYTTYPYLAADWTSGEEIKAVKGLYWNMLRGNILLFFDYLKFISLIPSDSALNYIIMKDKMKKMM